MGFHTTYSMKDRVLQLTISCCIAYEYQMLNISIITNSYVASLDA
jgi:hypothetical protein